MWANGATGLLNTSSLNAMSIAVSGLSKEQALLILSTKNLTNVQKEQVLVAAGIISTNERIMASVISQSLAKSTLSATEKEGLLTKLGLINATTTEIIANATCTKEALLKALATKGIVGAEAEAIVSSLGLTTANITQAVSFDVLTASIWANIKALGKWLITNPIGWAILGVTAIFGLVKAYDVLTDSVEEVKTKTDNLLKSYDSAINKANENAKSIESIASKYEELSKGVNKLGENVSLTTDEYAEYNNIVNDIADMFPTLISGYTDEGNAILSLKGNVEELRDAYKEAQLEAYRLLITKTKENNPNDIVRNFQTTAYEGQDNGLLRMSEPGGNFEEFDYLNDILELLSKSNSRDLLKEKMGLNTPFDASDDDKEFRRWFEYLTGLSADGVAYIDKLSDKEIGSLITSLTTKATIAKSELENALVFEKEQANAFLNVFLSEDKYKELDEKSKNVASIFINNINTNIAKGFESYSDIGDYVQSILNTIKDNPDVKDAMIGLFTDDMTEIPPDKAKEIVDQYIDKIAEALGEDAVELKIRLGFEGTDVLATKYENAITQFSSKFSIAPEELQKYFDENSINTTEEIDKWIEIANKCDTATEAKKKYLQVDFSTNTFSLTTSNIEAIDNYRSKISTLKTALDNLSSGDVDMSALYTEFPTLINSSNDLEQALKNLITSELNTLYNKLGKNIPDNLSNSLQEIADKAINTSTSIGDSLSSLQKSYDAVSIFNNATKKGSKGITEDVLKSVSSLSGELNSMVASFYAGAVSSNELYSALNNHYTNDLKNYSQAVIQKNLMNEEFYNAMGFSSAETVNKFMDDYGIDISNCKNYNEAKLRVEQETIKIISSKWSQYYNVHTKTYTSQMETLGRSAEILARQGVSEEQNPFLNQSREIGNLVQTYEDAIAGLDDIAFSGINSTFNKLNNELATNASDNSSKNKEYIESYINFMEAQLDAGKITYKKYCDEVSAYLKKMYSDGKLSAEDYHTYTKQMLEKQLDIYDKVLSSVTRRFDTEIQKTQDVIDSIEKQNDALENQKDKYDSVISAVQELIDSKKEEVQSSIDALEKENDSLNDQVGKYDSVLNAVQKVYDEKQDALRSEQDAIQERIDALQDENDEHKRAIELQKAKYELARSQNQRTQFTFDGEQFVYMADEQAIKENQEKLADLELEQTISGLEKEKEALQELIDELDRYKEQWSDIANAYQEAKDKEIAKNILGENYTEDILLNRAEDIEAFKDRYLAAQQKIDDNTSMIESYNQKLEYYESLKKKWDDLSSEKEHATNRQIAAELLGKEWEAMILEDRLVSFDDFRNQYLTIQQQIEDNTGLINSYNEKVTYYENLKKQWSDVTSAYQNSIDDQYAAMVLGKNWEADILSGKIATLNSYKNDYIQLQQAIAQADVDRYNIQVDAAKKAAAQINSANASIKNDANISGDYGNKDNTNGNKPTERYQVVDIRTGRPQKAGFNSVQEALNWMNLQPHLNSIKSHLRIQKYANGGIVGKDGHDPSLDAIARTFGEDHMVAVKEGETILPSKLPFDPPTKIVIGKPDPFQYMYPMFRQPIVPNNTFNSNEAYKSLNLEPRETNQTTNISFGGDINLEGVQDPNTFAKQLVSAMRNRTTQKLFTNI